MKIFFDTEFTGLHKNTTLISLGCIDEDGRTFYAEFSDYDESQVTSWIHENVISNLKWSKAGPSENFYKIINNKGSIECFGDKKYVKSIFIAWLEKYEKEKIQFVSDVCHYDMVLLIDIFGDAIEDLPKNISPVCHDICQDIARAHSLNTNVAFNIDREELLNYPIEGEKHNSLYDAKVIRIIYYKYRTPVL